MPVVGVQTAVDVNEYAGTATRATGQRTVLATERKLTGPPKYRGWVYRFTLETGDPIGGYAIPRVVRVERSVYHAVQRGDRVDVTVCRGSLGLPWIEIDAVVSPQR